MKTNLLIFFTLLLGLFSCNAQKLEETPKPQDAQPLSDVISTDEALDQLYDFIDAMSPATRAGGQYSRSKAIRDIKASGGGLATRGTECDIPDTLVYVVNFADDEGYAVLGARRTVEPIFALTESGSLDAEKLNAAIAEVQQQMLDGESATTRSSDDNEPIQEIGADIIYPLLAQAMAAPAPRITPPAFIKEEIGPWSITSSIGPLVEVKWDQRYPFNISMPIASPSQTNFGPTTKYKGHYPTGCVMVAASQIMSKVLMPNYIMGTKDQKYFWTPIVANVARFSNLRDFSPLTYDTATTSTEKFYLGQLADAVYYLGRQLDAKYTINGTSAATAALLNYLKQINPIYYSNAKIVSLLENVNNIKMCLDNGKPVYTEGKLSNNSKGHAWIVDGYVNCKREIIRYYSNGYMPGFTQKRSETCILWHNNWGYGGRNDGYFAEAVFNMSNRLWVDPTIDDNGFVDQSIGFNFNISLKAIIY